MQHFCLLEIFKLIALRIFQKPTTSADTDKIFTQQLLV